MCLSFAERLTETGTTVGVLFVADQGARLAIRMLQDAAERGEIDPWDVDVIAVVDGFLDQLRQRIELPARLTVVGGGGGRFERDLAQSSEAFLAASVLVGLKAELLEASTFPPEAPADDPFDLEGEDAEWQTSRWDMPRRPERHLLRRPVAPPPLRRSVSLGELIQQLEDIAAQLERGERAGRPRQRPRRYSERAAIAQVTALAHREKLPETTAALSRFLGDWDPIRSRQWVDFEALVRAWADGGDADLDHDRVDVFWALLFLCSQGKVELRQDGGLFGMLSLRKPLEAVQGMVAEPPGAQGSAPGPARELLAA